MSAGLGWQYAVIAAVVAVSVLFMFRKLAPQVAARWQAAVAMSLTNPARSRVVRRLGRSLMPNNQGGGACGDGCSTCGACDTSDKPQEGDIQPLRFHPRGRERR